LPKLARKAERVGLRPLQLICVAEVLDVLEHADEECANGLAAPEGGADDRRVEDDVGRQRIGHRCVVARFHRGAKRL
jgi:hypothetical protein